MIVMLLENKPKQLSRIDLGGRIRSILYYAGFNREQAVTDICKLIANNYRRRKKV